MCSSFMTPFMGINDVKTFVVVGCFIACDSFVNFIGLGDTDDGVGGTVGDNVGKIGVKGSISREGIISEGINCGGVGLTVN